MNVTLSDEASRIIEAQVKSGHYPTAEAPVDAAIVHLAFSADEIDELRAAAEIGVREAAAGDFVEFTADEIIAECRAERYRVGACNSRRARLTHAFLTP
jgi:Arc/MetJ-type ribon-helix-helix transcriptional regulator